MPSLASTAAADRNLLFGALALQAALIDNSQFAEACAAWVTRKESPLADLLTERGWLTAEGRQEVERLVERHLKRHTGDLRVSLAALIGEDFQRTLSAINDEDLQRSLADLASAGGPSGIPTVDEAGGTRRRYTLVRLHAKGGIGQVWVARDGDLGRDVALKELKAERAGDPASWPRFLLEAQITGQLEHPGIVPVYELVRASPGEQAFYTMRFVRGRTLHAAIRDYHRRHAKGRTGRMDQLALLQAFVSVCNAVAYAHARGVVHRDLKGPNIVLGNFGEVVVLDWGLAKLVDRPDEENELPAVAVEGAVGTDGTIEGQVLGTPGYMAPEQASGRRGRIDRRTDVYGLGAILYEILTNRPPFPGSDRQEVLRKVREEEPARPRQVVPTVPRALEAVCLKAIAKRPNDRYQSARDLAEDVRRWLADEPVTAHREALARRFARQGRRHPTLVTAAALVLLAAAGGGFLVKHERDARAAEVAQAEQEKAVEAARQEGQIEADLEDSVRLVRAGNLTGARAAVDRAQQSLPPGRGPLQQRVYQMREDVDMVGRLEDVLRLETFTAGKHENRAADAAYGASFAGHGMDVSTGAADMAERIKASAIREHLITALDDWIFVKPPADTAGRQRLLAVVRLADADAWRQQLRDAAEHKDRAALEALARRPEVANQPPTILVHLGKYLAQASAWGPAVDVLSHAQRRHAGDFWVNHALGMALADQTPPRRGEAISYFRAALAIRPQSRMTHIVLGRALVDENRLAEAVAQFRQVDELAGRGEPNSIAILLSFGAQSEQRGEAGRALACVRVANDLLPTNDPRRQQLAVLIRTLEQAAHFEEKLDAVIKGKAQPANAAERIGFANVCRGKQLFAAAVRFYTEAFAAEPSLAQDMRTHARYLAACVAALAAAGNGKDADKLDAAAQAGLRKHALEWLRADFTFWTQVAASGQPQARVAVLTTLQQWQATPDLASLRDPDALKALDQEERRGFVALWEDVRKLLEKVREPGQGGK